MVSERRARNAAQRQLDRGDRVERLGHQLEALSSRMESRDVSHLRSFVTMPAYFATAARLAFLAVRTHYDNQTLEQVVEVEGDARPDESSADFLVRIAHGIDLQNLVEQGE